MQLNRWKSKDILKTLSFYARNKFYYARKILFGRTDAEVETPVFWSSDVNRCLIGKVPDAGKDWERRRKGHQRMRWLDGITDAMDVNLGKLWERARPRESWGTVVHGDTIELDTTEQLNKMTTMQEKNANSPNPTIISLFIIWTAETKAL